MENIILNGVEYTPVLKETVEDNRHQWRYWYPKNDYEKHFYINASGGLVIATTSAILSAECWNAFKTKEEAEKELAKRKAIVTIKRYISNTFGVFETDWDNKGKAKFSLSYNYIKNVFYFTYERRFQHYSPIWRLSCEKHAQEIIDKFDTELRIIFNV